MPLFVVALFSGERPDLWVIHDVLEAQQLPYIVVQVSDDDRIVGDGHPNPRGAQQIADAVSAALRNMGVGAR